MMTIDIWARLLASGALDEAEAKVERVNGYLYNGEFYSDIQHTQLIEKNERNIYIDLADNKMYVVKNGVYTLVAGGGGGDVIGEITLLASQVVQENPVKVQLTEEQFGVLEAHDLLRIDASNIGCGVSIFIKATSENGNHYVLTMQECTYDVSTLEAIKSRQDLIIVPKTGTTHIATYSKLTLLGPNDVAANPTAQATDTLTKIRMPDGTIYAVAGGSGGVSDVKVNGVSVVSDGVANIVQSVDVFDGDL